MHGHGKILQLDPHDTVALALGDIEAGERLADGKIEAKDPVPSGHKIAVVDVPEGGVIYKYGQAIGVALSSIPAGAHVHTHNLSARVVSAAAASAPDAAYAPQPRRATFQGYRRADGRVGTRNFVAVLTSVNCSGTVAKKVADSFPDVLFEDDPNFDGVMAVTHTTGCGMAGSGEAVDVLRRTIAGYARHPNFAGALVIGLGCEVNQIDTLFQKTGLTPGETLRQMTIQEAGGTAAAIKMGRDIVGELIERARSARRETVGAEHLTLGLQCGASDGWSGVTANPALGRAVDQLVASGGTAILSETPEIYGAEQLLYARARSEAVRKELGARLEWWQDYATRHHMELDNNPSPGNKKGGLTTILEKSLGAIAKSGRTTLEGVYLYGETIDRCGVVFMDSPGYDPCSATGQIAAGANILSFTTGRGSVFGSKPAPCIKLASNARVAQHMAEDMDVDCSPVLDGVSLDDMGERIFQTLLRVASGEKSKSEALGIGELEFVPWQLGAVM